MLDSDLARLYGVATKRLNEQVRRNQDRFPDDFAFQLTSEEVANLRSQFATSNRGRSGGRPSASLQRPQPSRVLRREFAVTPVPVRPASRSA